VAGPRRTARLSCLKKAMSAAKRASSTLYGAKGGGSMIVEAAFARTQLAVEFVDLAWDDVGWGSRTLAPLNPLGQVPTLVMPDGGVMTESAAIVLHLSEQAPESGLVPAIDHPQHTVFLRWLVFLVSAVYPTFTYGDVPKRWVAGDEAAAKLLRAATDDHRKTLWRYVERHIDGPWFLGDTWSALDLYMWPMTFWRPGRDWFAAECPKLHAIGAAMDADPICKSVAARNGF
jgi:GST-like protein